jgi:hypothetical protein
MAPPQVKTPTEWPCENAALGEVVECPGTDDQNHICRKLVQIRAGTNPDKPSFGKHFIMHSKDDGGCGYFSYVVFKEGETKIGLEEPVYRRAKRKIATSEIPPTDIDPTEAKKAKVEHAGFQEQLDEVKARLDKLADAFCEVKTLQEEIAYLKKILVSLDPNEPSTNLEKFIVLTETATRHEKELFDVKQDVGKLTIRVNKMAAMI